MSCSFFWKREKAYGNVPSKREDASFTTWVDINGEKPRYILFGGHLGTRRNDLYILENVESVWKWDRPNSKGEPPPPTRGHSACVIYSPRENKPYFLLYGGQKDDRENESNVRLFDLTSSRWRKLYISHVPPARGCCSISALQSSVVIFGAKTSPEGFRLNDLWQLHLDAADFSETSLPSQVHTISGAAWKRVDRSGSVRPSARDNTAFARMDSRLYLYGGSTGFDYTEGVSDELWELNTDEMKWRCVETCGYPPGPRCGHCLWSLANDYLVVYGGMPSALPRDDFPRTPEIYMFAYLFDMNFYFWSKIRIGGASLDSFLALSWSIGPMLGRQALIFGGQALMVLKHSVRPGELDDDCLEEEEKSAEGRTEQIIMADSEAMLMATKKDALRLETELSQTSTEKARLAHELHRINRERNVEQIELLQATKLIQAMQDEEAQLSQLVNHLTTQVECYRSIYNEQKRSNKAFRKCVATGSAYTIAMEEGLQNQDLEVPAEAEFSRDDWHNSLKMLQNVLNNVNLNADPKDSDPWLKLQQTESKILECRACLKRLEKNKEHIKSYLPPPVEPHSPGGVASYINNI